MLIQLDIDIVEAFEAMDAIVAVVTENTLAEAAGAFAHNRILNRTLGGQDVHDSPFAPYSDSYARTKSGTVNLKQSGAMLNSISATGSGKSARIQCSSSIAQYHEQGTGKMPQRQFMGLSQQDTQDMIDELVIDVIGGLI